MELPLLAKIVEEAKEIIKEPYLLGICGIGEPILHPQFKEALDIIKQLPFSFGTNGQHFDPERINYAINARFTDITLSLDAILYKTHEKMRPGLELDRVMYNVNYFLDELRIRPRFWRNVFIQFIPTKANIGELDMFISYWLPIIQDIEGVRLFIKPMYQWPGLDNPFYPGVKVPINDNPKILWGPFDAEPTFRDRCRLFDDYVGIQSDGTYLPCCMPVEDEFGLGNVKDQTIMDIYKSPKMEEYRKLFREKRFDEIPFCNKCL